MCARKSTAVVIYWAAKSQNFFNHTISELPICVLFFTQPYCHLSFISFPWGVKVPFGLKTSPIFFSSAQLISSRPGCKVVLAEVSALQMLKHQLLHNFLALQSERKFQAHFCGDVGIVCTNTVFYIICDSVLLSTTSYYAVQDIPVM